MTIFIKRSHLSHRPNCLKTSTKTTANNKWQRLLATTSIKKAT